MAARKVPQKIYFLHAVGEDSEASDYLAKLTGGKRMRRLVGKEWKLLYRCPAGLRDVEIALRDAERLNLKIEAYEGAARGETSSGLTCHVPQWRTKR